MKHIKLFENFTLTEEEIENQKDILQYLSDDCGVDFEIRTSEKYRNIFIFESKKGFPTNFNRDYEGEIIFNNKMKRILDILLSNFIDNNLLFEIIIYKKEGKEGHHGIDIWIDNSSKKRVEGKLVPNKEKIILKGKYGDKKEEIKSMTEFPDKVVSFIRIEVKN